MIEAYHGEAIAAFTHRNNFRNAGRSGVMIVSGMPESGSYPVLHRINLSELFQCHSQPAINSATTKSSRCLARAGWAKCGIRTILGWAFRQASVGNRQTRGALRQALLRLAAFAGAARRTCYSARSRLADPTEQLRWGIFNRAGVVLIATNQNEDRKIGGRAR